MTFEELGVRLEELENTRATAARELEALRSSQERLEQMEQDRDALLEFYADAAPDVLEQRTPEKRHQIYKMGRLGVRANLDGSIEVTGPLVLKPEVCNSDAASWRRLTMS